MAELIQRVYFRTAGFPSCMGGGARFTRRESAEAHVTIGAFSQRIEYLSSFSAMCGLMILVGLTGLLFGSPWDLFKLKSW